jgi:DNA-binding MarR family transcriptional regulator
MIKFLKFDQVPLPIYKEVKGKEWIYYGEKNDYPNYLLRLYNNSAKHNAIITGKVDYICGNGWDAKTEDEMEKAKAYSMIDKVNTEGESLDDITKKFSTDLSIFGGYYVQVIWNKAGTEIAEIYHVDYYKVRTNIDNTIFYVAEDWVKNGTINSKPNYISYPAFDPNNKKGSQILYFKEYRAGSNIYSLPDYRGAITYIEVDISIGEYHLNTINNGMFTSKLINLNNGKVSEEEEERIEEQMKDKFSGSKNAGKFMLSFNDSAENAPTILDLSGTELDKHFNLLNLTVQQEIFSGHKITSPMLFGIKTEGQLGGRSELREASELFQNTYINTKQKSIEALVNYLYEFNGLTAHLELRKTEPIAFEFSEAIISANMTQDEIREKLGLPQIQKTESSGSQDVINALNSLSPLIATKVVESMSAEELRKLIGLAPEKTLQVPESSIVPMSLECSSHDKESEYLALFDGKGTPRDNFVILQSDRLTFSSEEEFNKFEKFADYTLNSVQESILKIIKETPKAVNSDIAKSVGVSEAIVEQTIGKLIDDLVIEEKVNRDGTATRKITQIGNDAIKKLTPITSFKVMYSYEERPNVPAAKSGSRPLCQKLYNSGDSLFYTREEIQNISIQLGYSVFQLCGGWYHNPDTGKTTPYCRHEWKRNVIVEKTSR